MSGADRPLIVRLRHWVGDVVLGVPALRLLQLHGYRLQLLGKPWAGALLAGEGWEVMPMPAQRRDRIALLRRLKQEAQAADPSFGRRVNSLLLPFSFSSALESRLVGLRSLGYAYEGRRLLLHRCLPRPRGVHELQAYWQLACELTGAHGQPPPRSIDLRVEPAAIEAAQRRLAAARMAPGFVLLCPFAGGTYDGRDKRWPLFAAFAVAAARAWQRPLVLCPGPNEVDEARQHFPDTVILERVNLGEYAALLKSCALMVSNDTGPGHLAAAVNAPLLSVLGPTDVAQWGPWGPDVHVCPQSEPGQWPSVDDVIDLGRRLLQRPH
ncbi:MAG: glycosyltransferase family 9 protein [Burkholderiaceae bacterium]|nr:glycosyltransferase family 9 protein [Burkholderiaceae bacterium]